MKADIAEVNRSSRHELRRIGPVGRHRRLGVAAIRLPWAENIHLARFRTKKMEEQMLEEFKKFIMRGNVVDLAVGVIIGVAFGAIVTSLVSDVIMPVIGAVTGGLDFSNYYLPLSTKIQPGLAYVDAKKQGAVLGWGQFLTVALNFLIIAAVLFLAIKGMNRLNKEEPPAPAPGPTPEVKLLTEIRDLLKK
jgi:large conductance mechanosensitive channel